MFESGAIISLGLIMWFAKCSWKTRIRLLSHPLALDILVFTVLTLLHWGTFSGVMAATIGAVMTSVLISAGRAMFGYMEKSNYVAGRINVKAKLMGDV